MERYDMEASKLKNGSLNSWVSLGFILSIIIAIALVAIGLILSSIAGTKEIGPMIPLNQLPKEILNLNAPAIISLGILILLLTPILQVVVAIVNLLIERNNLYAAISIALLCVLIFSLVLALS